MVTRLQDAKVKVVLETSDAEAALKKLEDQAAKGLVIKKPISQQYAERKKEEEERRRQQERAAKPDANPGDGVVRSGGPGNNFRFDVFNPLDTLISGTSAIPVAGPAIAGAAKFAIQAAPFGPAVSEFGKSMTEDIFKDAPPFIRDMIGYLAKKTDEAINVISNKVLELKGINDAVQPTVNQVAEMTKAAVLAGGVPKAGESLDMLSNIFKIQLAQNQLRLKLQQQTYKAMGTGLAEFLKQSFHQ